MINYQHPQPNHQKRQRLNLICLIAVLLLFGFSSYAVTKTATTTGNWSNPAIWSPAGVPSDTDNIIIKGNRTITIDGKYTVNNLDLGDNVDDPATLRIIAAGDSLTINGDLRINPNNRGKVYILDAGPGVINVAGTFSYWATSGDNYIRVSTGTINFTPAISTVDNEQYIQFTGAGTINFLAGYTDTKNQLTTFANCNVNFYGNYTVNTDNADWKSLGNANFYGTGTVTATSNLKLNTVNIMPSANTTFASAAGTLSVEGGLLINSAGSFTTYEDFELLGSFTNNGTFTSGAVTITMNGINVAIGGTSASTFSTLAIGRTGGGNDVTVTLSNNITAATLHLNQANRNRNLVIGTNRTLTVTGNATLFQPGKDNFSSKITVGNNTLNINGNLIFSGTNNSTKRVCSVETTAGSFTLGGTITWMSNSEVSTEVISVTSGTIILPVQS